MELFPRTCNYQMIQFKPYVMRRGVGKLLGLTNSSNLQSRLSKMTRLLNRGRITSRRRGGSSPRKYRRRNSKRRYNSRKYKR